MQRDSTVIQAAVLLIIIAILGVAILKKQQPEKTLPTPIIHKQIENSTPKSTSGTTTSGTVVFGSGTTTWSVSTGTKVSTKPKLVEQLNSPASALVKEYFAALAAKDFVKACSVFSTNKCSPSNPATVSNFATEYQKLAQGYEYLVVKDYGLQSPSGKNIVCVKYSYTYLGDTHPTQVSEVLSFYVALTNGRLAITDRVCEKKYKDGSGTRPCPIVAAQNFCLGNIK